MSWTPLIQCPFFGYSAKCVLLISFVEQNRRKFVEYYDSRDCAAAFDAVSENGAFMDGKLEIEFVWDQFTSLPPPANAFGGPPIGGPGTGFLLIW